MRSLSTAAQIYRIQSFRKSNIRGGAYVHASVLLKLFKCLRCNSHIYSAYSYKKGDLNKQFYLKTKSIYDKFIRSAS